MNGKKHSSEKVAKKLKALTCTTGALYMLPQVVQGAVVYVDNSPLRVDLGMANGTQVFWDVDGDGNDDFVLWKNMGSFGSYYLYLDSYDGINSTNLNGRGMVQGVSQSGDDVKSLMTGVLVGPTLAANYKWGSSSNDLRTVVTLTTLGSIAVGRDMDDFSPGTGFFGFKFENASGIHYGWAEINIDLNNPGSFTITRWAYEDEPNQEVLVGSQYAVNYSDAVSVPVGGAPLLALTALGLGAAGIRELRARRRRKEKQMN